MTKKVSTPSDAEPEGAAADEKGTTIVTEQKHVKSSDNKKVSDDGDDPFAALDWTNGIATLPGDLLRNGFFNFESLVLNGGSPINQGPVVQNVDSAIQQGGCTKYKKRSRCRKTVTGKKLRR